MTNFFRLALLLLGSLIWTSPWNAQNFGKIDSLQTLLASSTDEQQYAILADLTNAYRYTNIDSCIKYSSTLLIKATNNRDTLWMAKAEKIMGISLCVSGNLSTGLKHNIKAKKYYNVVDNQEGVYSIVSNIGYIYTMLKEPQKAIKHYHEAIPYFKQVGNQDALKIIYNNLVSSYTDINQLDSALYYLNILENTKTPSNPKEDEETFALKAKIYSKRNLLDSAKVFYTYEYERSKKAKDIYAENAALIGLGKLNKQEKHYSTALNFFELAEVISEKNRYKRILEDIYANKVEIYDSIKNYKSASLTLKKLQKIKDEIFESEIENNLAEIKIKYESEKQELELEKQRALLAKNLAIQKNKESRTFIIFIAIGIIMISLLINSYLKKQSRKKLEQQKKHIETQQNKIVGSINYAKRIQESILKPKSEIEELFPSSFVYFKPKDIVSGDFYWFKEFGDIKVIATVDCIGHGVPGAFMSLIINNLLEKHVTGTSLHSPGKILENLHQELLDNSNLTTAYKGMDMSLCVIHEKNKHLCFSGARNSAYIYNRGSFKKLEADLFSIGAESTKPVKFETRRYELQKEDVLYMYTDGFIDQFGGEKAKKLNTQKFKKLIEDLESIKFKNIPNHINNFLIDWQGNIPQTDDILIFGVKIL